MRAHLFFTFFSGLKETRPCAKYVATIRIAAGAYLPQCNNNDGTYKVKQCHRFAKLVTGVSKTAGTCWCVHPNTGVEIKGTQTKIEEAGKLNCGI